jgi:NADP-dependent aldehyde dehydrogenase
MRDNLRDEESQTMTVITTDVDQVVTPAAGAAAEMARATDEQRARWLVAVADALDAAAGELVPIAIAETHLAEARLTGEVARTSGQLRMFAAVVRDGAYLEAIVDHARPDATPPQPDLRRLLVPVGPVAVYAASNFPFAFSVAGGDTASALAVGCPVVVKAHPGHPELSRRTAEIVAGALSAAGAPAGAFGLVEGFEAGAALVRHPAIRAAAFTGSLHGGRALFDLASARPTPIPFYAELGSVNPVVVTPDAARTAAADLARGLVGSFTLGAGQFCTKPGVVLVPAGEGFEEALADAAADVAAAPLLNDRIGDGFARGLDALVGHRDVEVIAGQPGAGSPEAPAPVVLATSASAVAADPDTLLAECFGPVTLLVRYADDTERQAVLDALEGSLTATVHAAPGEDVADLTATLANTAGRVLFGGWPTGVAVTWSQHHGGPWPATTSIHTSVGATAVRRFQRPVVYQDAPEAALPLALQDRNPLGIPRRVDGLLEV